MPRPWRRVLVLAPALAAGAWLVVAPSGLAALSADPGAARLADVLDAASWMLPLATAGLAWRFNQWRLALGALVLASLGLFARSLPLDGPGAPALLLGLALGLGLAAHLDERGVLTRTGVARFALVGALLLLPAGLAARWPADLAELLARLGPAPQPTPGLGVPWAGLVVAAALAWGMTRAGGRDGDVAGAASLAVLGAATVVVVAAEGSVLDAPRLVPPVALLGACGTVVAGTLVVAWRRGYVDDLTRLPGRRALDEALDALRGEYAVAVVDVDHFKKFNDEHGHDAGDDVLRIVADVLSRVRGGKAYRQGGEEFVVLFQRASLDDAASALEDLRRAIEATPLLVRGSAGRRRRALRITASMGVAARAAREAGSREVLRAADQALLRAKRLGRNRVERGRGRGRAVA